MCEGQSLTFILQGTVKLSNIRHLHMHKRDNLLYFAPPLVIAREEIDEALVALGAALDEAHG